MDTKKTLYIGAHPDDVLLGAGITISRNPQDAMVLILSNGATIDESFPAKHGMSSFDSYQDFARTRLKEDRRAMSEIGLNVSRNYIIAGDIPTEIGYTQIPFFVDLITGLVKSNGIERIVTHEFGEAHPDHDVASFVAHNVANKFRIEVWEYPLYHINGEVKEISQTFIGKDFSDIEVTEYNPEEIKLKNRLMNIYQSQIYIVDMFTATRDQFGRIQRDFSNGSVPESVYFYKDAQGHPSPEQIRKAIGTFLSQSKPI